MSLEMPQDDHVMADDPASRLEELVGYHLRRASVFDLQGAVSALEATNTRPVPLSVLVCIQETPGISSAEICRRLGMQRANIVSILANLEERGLFLRETDAADQRIQRLFPTRRGEAEAAHGLALLTEHERRLLHRLSAAEQKELRRLLAKIWQEDEHCG
ncbi:MarR family transcriptional regulator [Pseudomonas aeruginosa]|uniref:MarR family winged helix-turn-helix transcriptional regulator n=1 Tax=Pseudomonas aeruginosa TaxID=287 RepID=UPI000935D9B2|nr:MarR family transcriptional regulator [Pseudomonas aeruginosa]EKJ8518157.1 MarR family transcriptional regulator [Pseudomonas aeruginosa]ELK7308577.1 MarR family transcriptional regulator [Pseudomonas aeruginosa]ELP0276296.1 MarR family transcriptional regulator [Pseudomonas aeruginosa]MBG4807683.1 MarR family transcriptional regulator [Pseudomonas aeruginosa]MBG5029224.1 MarR family transcriptional regulator [Pseudomonas aeruginosa]